MRGCGRKADPRQSNEPSSLSQTTANGQAAGRVAPRQTPKEPWSVRTAAVRLFGFGLAGCGSGEERAKPKRRRDSVVRCGAGKPRARYDSCGAPAEQRGKPGFQCGGRFQKIARCTDGGREALLELCSFFSELTADVRKCHPVHDILPLFLHSASPALVRSTSKPTDAGIHASTAPSTGKSRQTSDARKQLFLEPSVNRRCAPASSGALRCLRDASDEPRLVWISRNTDSCCLCRANHPIDACRCLCRATIAEMPDFGLLWGCMAKAMHTAAKTIVTRLCVQGRPDKGLGHSACPTPQARHASSFGPFRTLGAEHSDGQPS